MPDILDAAPFALLVGWDHAKNAYGRLMEADANLYLDLVALVEDCKQHRDIASMSDTTERMSPDWYYGEDVARLVLQRFTPMAATIAGVYEAVADGATLLDSKSLQREACWSPFQRDIAGLATRALQGAFVKELTKVKQPALPPAHCL